MNILLYDMSSFTQNDLIYYLRQAGHKCKNIIYKFKNIYHDPYFVRYFSSCLQNTHFDCVISTNFFPLVAQVCYENNIKYLAWSYDSPIARHHLEYYNYPTNYIFLFDKEEVFYFRGLGLERFYHLPLAVNLKRLQNIAIKPKEITEYACDVSFIGQFYKSPLRDLLILQDDYTKGYINAIADAQLKVYGYNFVAELVPQELVEQMNSNFSAKNLRIHESNGDVLSREGLIHSINKQITRTERIVLLQLLSQHYHVHIYSSEQLAMLNQAIYRGTADYLTEMPKIFRLSKININPTLRSIHSGIPLRALDIMGSGGFLLSNYQPELAEYFQPNIDVVMYESIEDALCKADYYLTHEEERKKIIQNALHILDEHFTYPQRITTMLQVADLIE